MPEEKIEVFQSLTLLSAPACSTTVKFSDSLPSRRSVPPCRRGGRDSCGRLVPPLIGNFASAGRQRGRRGPIAAARSPRTGSFSGISRIDPQGAGASVFLSNCRRILHLPRACHQLAGFGRWAPPEPRMGVSPDCHTQPSIGTGRCATGSGAVVSSIHRRSVCWRLTDDAAIRTA
jgi:hypothetical protein